MGAEWKQRVVWFGGAVLFVVGTPLIAEAGAGAQSAAAKDPCDLVHTAYNKSLQASSGTSAKNSGAVNVTKVLGEITQDGSYTESCKLLREENLNGEAASVYSDIMKSHGQTADGKVWISKSQGLILQQEVEVDMGAKGKGKQTLVFNYKKK